MMLRKTLALLVAGVLVFGGMSPATAQSNLEQQKSVLPAPTAAPAARAPQLAPGRAAGVKEAQATFRNPIWNYVPFGVVSGLAALIVLMTGNDDEETTVASTTGTN